jgi:hypothetical protein
VPTKKSARSSPVFGLPRYLLHANPPKISTAPIFFPSNPILNPRSPPLPLSTTSPFPHFAPNFTYKPPSGVPTTSLLHPPQISTTEATSSPLPIPIHSCHRSSAVFSSTLPTGSPPLAASLLVPLQQPPVPRSVPLFLKKASMNKTNQGLHCCSSITVASPHPIYSRSSPYLLPSAQVSEPLSSPPTEQLQHHHQCLRRRYRFLASPVLYSKAVNSGWQLVTRGSSITAAL